jgi:hypothetical protein
MDSISVGPGSAVSKSMVGLIRGAREVRRLIREASFDSVASEFSLGVSLADDLCDADRKGSRFLVLRQFVYFVYQNVMFAITLI